MTHVLINDKFENINTKDLSKHNIRLIIFDPIDNIGLKYNNYNDKISDKYYIWLLETWLYKCKNITTGPIFFTFNIKWTYDVEYIIKNLNIDIVERLYWYFTFGQSSKKKYTNSVRPIYWLNSDFIIPENIKIPSKRQEIYNDKRAKSGGKMPDNLWQFNRICGTFKERRAWHPCQINEKIIERIVLGHSKENDTVLDPAIGSGTTAIVCKKTNRNVVGIDSSKLYIDKIQEILF